jgi:hypothetical protein
MISAAERIPARSLLLNRLARLNLNTLSQAKRNAILIGI